MRSLHQVSLGVIWGLCKGYWGYMNYIGMRNDSAGDYRVILKVCRVYVVMIRGLYRVLYRLHWDHIRMRRG